MADWWYYYYCRGINKDKSTYDISDFALATYKVTPDFANYKYEPIKCRFQIGQNIQKGSVVILNTTVGKKNKKRFITGYYTVERVGNSQPSIATKGKFTCSPIYMDKDNSLLLLDNPIEINYDYALKLFPEEMDKWERNNRSLLENLSSKTRNNHLSKFQKKTIITDLKELYDNGSQNYLGSNYNL
ncbi:MAG: hypothetical protein ACTSRG_17455 [Candidatus Helarchaeota archaeon]